MSPDSEAARPADLFSRVESLFAALSQIALFVLLILVGVQVVTRYLLNNPIGEVVSITETYLMPAMVFFAIASLQRRDGHIRVDLIYGKLSGRRKLLIDALIDALSAVFWAIVVYASAADTLFSLRMGYEVSKELTLPLASAQVIVPIGGLLVTIRLLLQMVGAFRALGQPREFPPA